MGNYGPTDQQLGLQFAFNNIARFGGDPSRITIFGESAGAMSVCWHLVSQISRPWFTAAIMESGTCSSAELFVSLPRALHFSATFISALNCTPANSSAGYPDELACLRKAPLSALLAAFDVWPQNDRPPLAPCIPWGPVVDGVLQVCVHLFLLIFGV